MRFGKRSKLLPLSCKPIKNVIIYIYIFFSFHATRRTRKSGIGGKNKDPGSLPYKLLLPKGIWIARRNSKQGFSIIIMTSLKSQRMKNFEALRTLFLCKVKNV